MSFLVLFVSAFCISAVWTFQPYAIENAEIHFLDFIEKHGKQYADEVERQARFEIFKQNLEHIIRMNEERGEILFGLTHFMDLTHEEFINQYTGLKYPAVGDKVCSQLSDENINDDEAPESFDWREHNVVTPIKDQSPCYTCYAFSAVANVESQYAIKYKQQLDLSEQQVVDCDKLDDGNNGGLPERVFQWLLGAGGIVNEADYPSNPKCQGVCSFDESKVQVKLSDCHTFQLTSQEKVKKLLYKNGPLSIGIRASNIKYVDNDRIVTDADCVGELNHAVLLVGYGTENGMPYWIVKNSWGQNWGNQGYFRMQRGENAESCGMMNDSMSTAVIE